MKPFTIYCLSTAQSPITHMAGVEGNRGIVAREEVSTPLGTRRVPFLSGCALRHCCLREPGFLWLARAYGLDRELTKPELYFLLNGGAAYVGNAGRESTSTVCDFKELSPLGAALGGTLPSQIISGSINVDRGVLVCEENAARLPTFLPDGVLDDVPALRPADQFIGDWQYTRSAATDLIAVSHDRKQDAAERQRVWEAWEGTNKPASPAETPLPGEECGKSAQMIYGGECVNPCAAFAHRFTIVHPSRLTIGAVLFSLRLWMEQGNLIGGMAAKGHGILRTVCLHDPIDGDPEQEYLDVALANRGRFVDWIKRQFRKEVAAKPAKGKRGKSEKAEASPA